MYVKIPFESSIEFKTNISEITKMSLEHDFSVSDGVILGNFYVSGEYRVHEVSINKEPFKYTLPFTVELRDDLDRDTLEFNIEDFSYDIENNNTLKVNIVYSLKGDVKEEEEELFTRVNEEELDSELKKIDEVLNSKEVNDENEEKEKIEVKEEKEEKEIPEEKKEENMDEERLNASEEKTVMETIKNSDDTFVTYHIHIVKENETLEGICSLYGVNSNLISEYNVIDNLNVGDKILIPKIDE